MVRTEGRSATPWIFLATALAIYAGGAFLALPYDLGVFAGVY